MGAIGRVKKYKAFFVNNVGKNIDYTTFVYAQDTDEAKKRADAIMKDMEDDSLVMTSVVLITNQGSNWSGIYR
jgi:hypothetical protein